MTVLLLLMGWLNAATYHVQDDFDTIKEAIDIAVNGDEILAGPGTHYGQVNFHGKSITIHSTDGPELTTIHGQFAGSAVLAVSGESELAVLDGFTITGGNGYDTGSSVIGGGVVVRDTSSPTLRNLIITGNNAEAADHSGIGGGIAISMGANPILENCIVEYNTSNFGGGIGIYQSQIPILRNVIFRMNNANYGGGGGLFIENSNPEIHNCTFHDNEAVSGGGAIHLHNEGHAVMNKITVVNNESSYNNSALILSDNSSCFIYNSIFWDNPGAEIELFWMNGFGDCSVTIGTSNIEDGENGIVSDEHGSCYLYPDWINEPPCFLDSENADFALLPDSPCIDSGINILPLDESFYYLPDDTWAGDAPDMGSWEFTYLLGDPNADDALNVLDVVQIVNYILNTEPEDPYVLWCSDMNGDAALDVLDVIQLINIILELPARSSATDSGTARIHSDDGLIYLESDTPIAGIQITLKDPATIHPHCPSGWECRTNDHMLLAYNLSGSPLSDALIAQITADVQLADFIAADLSGQAVSVHYADHPTQYGLGEPYPNPFNPVLTIPFSLAQAGPVTLKVFDITGREVATLADSQLLSGNHRISWNAAEYASGFYLVQLQTANQECIRKIQLVK